MTKEKISVVIATLALVVALGVAMFKGGEIKLSEIQLDKLVSTIENKFGATGTRFPNGLSTDSTSPAVGEVRTALLTATATTTLTQSVDGLVVGGTMSTAATGTVRTIYTNTTGPKVCDTDTGYLHVMNNGSFAPSMTFSIGTSTSAVAATNLIASTTFATTTPGTTAIDFVPFVTGRLIRLLNGDVITGIFGDNTGQGVIGGASSTNYANRSVEIGLWCQDVTI